MFPFWHLVVRALEVRALFQSSVNCKYLCSPGYIVGVTGHPRTNHQCLKASSFTKSPPANLPSPANVAKVLQNTPSDC